MILAWIAAASTALALATTSPALSPPSQPGPWRQVGAAMTSKPGKTLHRYRIVQNPKALGVVVASSSSRTIKLSWWSYCEMESDDVMTEENQGTITGVHLVNAYPPVLDGATTCYVWVNAGAGGTARVSAAIFAY